MPATLLASLGVALAPGSAGRPVSIGAPGGHGRDTAVLLPAQDRAARTVMVTVPPFFAVAVGAQLLALVCGSWFARRRRRGAGQDTRPGRLGHSLRWASHALALTGAAVPAGCFLAGLVPWWTQPHPALALSASATACAAVVATAAGARPWRSRPLGPVGAVCAITCLLLLIDLVTGSRLQVALAIGRGQKLFDPGPLSVVEDSHTSHPTNKSRPLEGSWQKRPSCRPR